MPLVHFFETSFGRTTHRRIILVEVVSQGVSGWGEVTCGENPFYNEEWTDAAWMIVRDYVAPRVLHVSVRERRGCSATAANIFAATTWLAAAWKPRSGIWKRG